MNPGTIERVFGRGRLKMATGEHVEVHREAVSPGERRRYTKRFLETGDADFREWTGREWRILARLIGHGVRCVPDVVQFDGGAGGGVRQVQTYDAGVTVDQWATLLPVERDGVALRHVFEDCAHWWALAHHVLAALDEIHALGLVHLDLKADNICIPYAPADFDPGAPAGPLSVQFGRLALIDFAFSLVSREKLATALPLGWQKDYDYQSPRMLRALDAARDGDLEPTQDLDWRCDLYSLAAMLRRYLPDEAWALAQGVASGWTTERYDDARELVLQLRAAHDRDVTAARPHRAWLDQSAARLAQSDHAASLDAGWTLSTQPPVALSSLATPLTRIAVRAATARPSRIAVPASDAGAMPLVIRRRLKAASLTEPTIRTAATAIASPRPRRTSLRPMMAAFVAAAALAAPAMLGDVEPTFVPVEALRPSLPPASATADPTPAAAAAAAAPDAEPGSGPASANEERAAAATTATEHGQAAPATTESDVRRADGTPERIAPNPRHAARRNAEAPASRSSKSRPDAGKPTGAGTGKSRPPVADAQSRIAAPGSAATPRPGTLSAAARSTERHDPVASRNATRALALAAISKPAAAAGSGAGVAPRIDAAPTTAESLPSASPPATGATGPRDGAQAPANQPTPVPPTMPPSRAADPGSNPVAADAERAAPSTAPDPLRDIRTLFRTLGAIVQRPAPIDERRAPRVPNTADSPASGRSADAALPQGVPPRRSPPPADPPPGWPRADAPAIAAQPSQPTRMAPGGVDDELVRRGRRMLADRVPLAAAQARLDVSPALAAAARAEHPSQNREVVDTARRRWLSERSLLAESDRASQARTFHSAGKATYASGRVADALEIELGAFAADPHDPDIAGFLAFLHLRARPTQPETARHLALYALAIGGADRVDRAEDWNTFAIASALTGREVDAAHAFMVQLAIARDLEPTCRRARSAFVTFGERLRGPLMAMQERIRAHGRDDESPSCAWPWSGTIARGG